MATDERGLNPRQAAFVREYLVDLNATQAAIRAGYSAKTAQEQSSRLLSNAIVKAAIDDGQARRAAKVDLTAETVIEGLMREACADDGPTCKTARVRAWELLAKHLGMMADRSKVEVSGDVTAYLAASLDRMNRLYGPQDPAGE